MNFYDVVFRLFLGSVLLTACCSVAIVSGKYIHSIQKDRRLVPHNVISIIYKIPRISRIHSIILFDERLNIGMLLQPQQT
jgi:hypothetical protein